MITEKELDSLKVFHQELESYISMREFRIEQDWLELFQEDREIEYEAFLKTIEKDFENDIEKIVSEKFHQKDEINFSLKSLLDEAGILAEKHWNSRNELEIKRDSLLNFKHGFYNGVYKSCPTIQKFKRIEEERIEEGQYVYEYLLKQFKTFYIDQIKNNSLSDKLEKQTLIEFASQESVHYYANRNEDEIKRDEYAYVTRINYFQAVRYSLECVISDLQSDVQDEFETLALIHLHNKRKEDIEDFKQEYDGFVWDFVREFYEKRTLEKAALDKKYLIDCGTYSDWGDEIIRILKNKYRGSESFDFECLDTTNDGYYSESNRQYEKYGGYNGYDDDTIDSAFEGDPENTWNVN